MYPIAGEVGEAKTRSRSRSAILAGANRCIYCSEPPETVEHMPPVAMFRGRHRLSGFEFPCCEDCNHSTRASDAAAAFLARISPTNQLDEFELGEAQRLLRSLAQLTPDFAREFLVQSNAERVWARGRDPLLAPKIRLKLDGAETHRLIFKFGTKLGMALFAHHIEEPLPEDGAVFVKFFFNAGLSRGEADTTVSILPLAGQMTQGSKSSGESFFYRYNTDLRSIVAALASFHNNLYFRIFATSDQAIIAALEAITDHRAFRIGDLKI